MRSYHYRLPKLKRRTLRVFVWIIAVVTGIAVYSLLHLIGQLAR